MEPEEAGETEHDESDDGSVVGAACCLPSPTCLDRK